MQLTGKNLIGARESAAGNETFAAMDPSSNRPLDTDFHPATRDEVDRAAELAAGAASKLRQKSPRETAALLRDIAGRIEALGGDLHERFTGETALPEARAKGETARTSGQLRLFADLVEEGSWVDARIDRAKPEAQPPAPDLRRMLRPVGPVAVFGASNFPLAFSTAGGDTASALAAGNPVVVKAHPSHPGTAELVARAILGAVEDHSFPDGTFSMVHGGREVGEWLVRHPKLEAVGFTGSFQAGRALWKMAAERPKPIPVYAEMGSVNPVVVLPKSLRAQAETIADNLAASVCLGTGQFCTKPGLVFFVEGDGAGVFRSKLRDNLQATAPATLLSAGIAEGYREGLHRTTTTDGVRTLLNENSNEESNTAKPALFEVSAQTLADHPNLAEETFGPTTLLVRCTSFAELEQAVATLPGQLTGTLYADKAEKDAAQPLVRLLEQRVGRLLFGGMPTGVSVSPAMNHGGPWPASSDIRSTSVGTAAIQRFARPICLQNAPSEFLPEALQDGNSLGILRQVDGILTRDPL